LVWPTRTSTPGKPACPRAAQLRLGPVDFGLHRAQLRVVVLGQLLQVHQGGQGRGFIECAAECPPRRQLASRQPVQRHQHLLGLQPGSLHPLAGVHDLGVCLDQFVPCGFTAAHPQLHALSHLLEQGQVFLAHGRLGPAQQVLLGQQARFACDGVARQGDGVAGPPCISFGITDCP